MNGRKIFHTLLLLLRFVRACVIVVLAAFLFAHTAAAKKSAGIVPTVTVAPAAAAAATSDDCASSSAVLEAQIVHYSYWDAFRNWSGVLFRDVADEKDGNKISSSFSTSPVSPPDECWMSAHRVRLLGSRALWSAKRTSSFEVCLHSPEPLKRCSAERPLRIVAAMTFYDRDDTLGNTAARELELPAEEEEFLSGTLHCLHVDPCEIAQLAGDASSSEASIIVDLALSGFRFVDAIARPVAVARSSSVLMLSRALQPGGCRHMAWNYNGPVTIMWRSEACGELFDCVVRSNAEDSDLELQTANYYAVHGSDRGANNSRRWLVEKAENESAENESSENEALENESSVRLVDEDPEDELALGNILEAIATDARSTWNFVMDGATRHALTESHRRHWGVHYLKRPPLGDERPAGPADYAAVGPMQKERDNPTAEKRNGGAYTSSSASTEPENGTTSRPQQNWTDERCKNNSLESLGAQLTVLSAADPLAPVCVEDINGTSESSSFFAASAAFRGSSSAFSSSPSSCEHSRISFRVSHDEIQKEAQQEDTTDNESNSSGSSSPTTSLLSSLSFRVIVMVGLLLVLLL